MRLSWSLPIAAVIGSVFAGNSPSATSAADNQWQNWVTVTETKTDYKVSISVSTSYVTIQQQVTVPTTIKETVTQTVPTTIKETVTQTVTSYVTQAPNTVAVTNVLTVTVTVPQLVTSVIPTTVAVTAVVTTTAVRTITSTQSALSGLVTCPPRIINPTYTPATPLPSTYLWGCPPGSLCYPPRDNCNFEQDLPGPKYVCKPSDCRPVARLPDLNVFLNANAYEGNGTCAFLTPVDDYFNIRPLDFGLNYGIFDIYGQKTCSSSVVCPGPSTVTIKNPVTIAQTVTVPVPTTLVETKISEVPKPITVINTETVKVPSPVTIIAEKSSSTWAAWQGSGAPPKVTKRAELPKRQDNLAGQPFIAYENCYPQCDYAGYAWQSLGNVAADLCNGDGDYIRAYAAATLCIQSCRDGGDCGQSANIQQLDTPRSICNQPAAKRGLFGRKAAH